MHMPNKEIICELSLANKQICLSAVNNYLRVFAHELKITFTLYVQKRKEKMSY